MKTIKWGILGLGNIANKFAHALAVSEGATLHAVASRNKNKAEAFATQYGASVAYGSYEELANDNDLDIIYIATPHGRHHQDAILCLESGRNVLCEKALALNLRQVEEIIAAAQAHNCFLMEAIWTRFHPNFLKMMELINEGAIGPVQLIRADFGFKTDYDETNRLWNPSLGGGSLLDIGIYPLFLALQVLGKPDEVQASAKLAPSGVDASMSMQLIYKDGRRAQLFSSFEADTLIEAELYGPERRLLMHNRWHTPAPLSLWQRNDCIQRWEFDDVAGYMYEILHVGECLRNDLKESPLLPLDFSKQLISIMDTIRKSTGVRYSAD